MSNKKTSYISKASDANGIVPYTPEENAIWKALVERQLPIVQNRGCDAYLKGLELLNLPRDSVPQCHEVTKVLQATTGWTLAPVPALIPFDQFFQLLANKKFPAATFIRRKEDMDYLQEPDIFHEVFGHCPLLTDPAYAEFTHTYGKLGLKANHDDRILLARLFWFTNEFGLIKTPAGLRIYGGGILSSPSETVYCLESDIPKRKPLNVLDALRTPYRIDIMQPIYFVIDSFDTLFHLTDMDLMDLVKQSRELGEFKPLFAKAV